MVLTRAITVVDIDRIDQEQNGEFTKSRFADYLPSRSRTLEFLRHVQCFLSKINVALSLEHEQRQ